MFSISRVYIITESMKIGLLMIMMVMVTTVFLMKVNQNQKDQLKKVKACLIKTHGSESRGQEEAACMHVFWPTRPLQ